MSQPKWKFVANLGDATPIDHDGLFVFIDETGEYSPEMEQLVSVGGEEEEERNDDDELISEGNEKWEVRRCTIEPCTYINGVLSDNPSHPDHPAWFADDLSSVCSSMDVEEQELIQMFCSDDVVQRALAWKMVGDHHGWDNFDSYPITFDSRREVEQRLEKRNIPY